MSFYGLVILFTFLIVAAYICAFSAEMRYEGSVNLAFDRFGSAVSAISYISAANLAGGGQEYINYTLAADGMPVESK